MEVESDFFIFIFAEGIFRRYLGILLEFLLLIIISADYFSNYIKIHVQRLAFRRQNVIF